MPYPMSKHYAWENSKPIIAVEAGKASPSNFLRLPTVAFPSEAIFRALARFSVLIIVMAFPRAFFEAN